MDRFLARCAADMAAVSMTGYLYHEDQKLVGRQHEKHGTQGQAPESLMEKGRRDEGIVYLYPPGKEDHLQI
jgi:hypothetical protein